MRRRFFLLFLAACVLGAGFAPAAAAGSLQSRGLAPFMLAESGHDRAKDAVRSGKVKPFRQVLGNIQSRYNGRLSDVRLEERGRGAWTYHVKWLTPQGNILVFTVNARTGRIMGVRGRGAGAARKR